MGNLYDNRVSCGHPLAVPDAAVQGQCFALSIVLFYVTRSHLLSTESAPLILSLRQYRLDIMDASSVATLSAVSPRQMRMKMLEFLHMSYVGKRWYWEVRQDVCLA